MKLACAASTIFHLSFAGGQSKPSVRPLWGEVEPKYLKYRVFGGDEIHGGSRRPYLVPVVGDYFCGGSLISPSAVMTAAHCVVLPDDDVKLWYPPEWVELNRQNWKNDTGVNRVYIKDRSQCVGDVVYHPFYNYTTQENSVAIIFLPNPITDITPVTLNEDHKIPHSGDLVDVSGWGAASTTDDYSDDDDDLTYKANEPRSHVLNNVNVNYVTNDECTKKPYRYKEDKILDSHMCLVQTEINSCHGDLGAPAVITGENDSFVQVGIVSVFQYTVGCANPRFPGVYTRVSEVADWVKEIVCTRKGELCEGSKAAKGSKKSKKYEDTCAQFTDAPTSSNAPTPDLTSDPPTMTRHTSTPWPTYNFTSSHPTSWPTWMPTKAPAPKASKTKSAVSI